MLTVDTSTLNADSANYVYVLEFDLEHGHVQVLGEGDVYPSSSGHGERYLESVQTGGCYSDPQMIANVELWAAEEHRLAIFPDEPSLRAGARQLAAAWGDELPVGIHRALA